MKWLFGMKYWVIELRVIKDFRECGMLVPLILFRSFLHFSSLFEVPAPG